MELNILKLSEKLKEYIKEAEEETGRSVLRRIEQGTVLCLTTPTGIINYQWGDYLCRGKREERVKASYITS